MFSKKKPSQDQSSRTNPEPIPLVMMSCALPGTADSDGQSNTHRKQSSRPPSSGSHTSNQSQEQGVSDPKQPSSNSGSSNVSSERRKPILREPASTASLFSICRQSDSPTHGQGMFANQSLSRGDLILREAPLVRWAKNAVVPFEHVWQGYISLPTAQRQRWYQLTHPQGAERKARFLQVGGLPKQHRLRGVEVAGLPTQRKLRAEILAKWENNSFGDMFDDSFLCVTGTRFNHSCQPNATWVLHPTSKVLEIRALTAIRQDEEIFINYCSLEFPRRRRLRELRDWGFDCKCRLCITQHTFPGSGAEQRRSLCNQVHGVLAALPSDDPGAQIGLYKRLLDMQRQEECFAWDVHANAIILASLYEKIGRDNIAAMLIHEAQELAVVCYGEDFVITEEWKAEVIKSRLEA